MPEVETVSRLLPEQGIHELFSSEYLQIINSLTQTDIFYGNPELIRDANYYAPLGGTIELGDGQRSHFRSCGELPGLLKGILSGGAIEYEEYFVRRIGHYFPHYILDFGELIHQINFVMQTSGGVDDYHIGVVRLG